MSWSFGDKADLESGAFLPLDWEPLCTEEATPLPFYLHPFIGIKVL